MLNRNECIYFLFEHKSFIDKNTPYQILRYMYLIWNEHKNQNPSTLKMPVVVSIIIYHGQNAWNVDNSMEPLFANIEGTEEYVPDFKSEVIDLSRHSDEQLGDQIELRAFLLALKYSGNPRIFSVLPEIIRLFRCLGEKEKVYLEVILLYIGSTVAKSKLGEFLKIIRVEHIDGVMYMETIADALREEGRKQVLKKTQQIEHALRKEMQQKEDALRKNAQRKEDALRQEAQRKENALRKSAQQKEKDEVQRMLQNNLSIKLIHKITGLSQEKIKKYKKKINGKS